MGELVTPDQLVAGEVFFDPRRPDAGLMYVEGVRTLKTVETYVVVDFKRLSTGSRGSINMIGNRTLDVERVQPMDPEFLADTISRLASGKHLTIFRHGEGVWA